MTRVVTMSARVSRMRVLWRRSRGRARIDDRGRRDVGWLFWNGLKLNVSWRRGVDEIDALAAIPVRGDFDAVRSTAPKHRAIEVADCDLVTVERNSRRS